MTDTLERWEGNFFDCLEGFIGGTIISFLLFFFIMLIAFLIYLIFW